VRFRWPLPLAIAALMAVPASAADQTVTAQPSIQWSPDEVTIDMGDTVTWNNAGGTHNVEFDDGSYTEPSNPRPDDWSVNRTFDTPGTFRYHCGFHGPAMSGVVKVRDASGNVPPPAQVDPGLDVSASSEQTLQRLLGRGLRARAGCENGCDIRLKISLAPKTAKRFGFARRRKTIGRETGSLPEGRTQPFDIALKAKAEDALADAKRAFKVRLDVRATNDTTETARRKIKITP
jgi:plastocyanin